MFTTVRLLRRASSPNRRLLNLYCTLLSPPLLSVRRFSRQALVNNAYNAARAPTKAQFDSFMRRIKLLKPATFDHMIRVLPLSSWTHHACDQRTRIGDTVTSNNAESLINQVGEAVRS